MPVIKFGRKLNICPEDVLFAQAADAAVVSRRNPRLLEVAERASRTAEELISPLVIYRKLVIVSRSKNKIHLIGGYNLTGELLIQQLSGAQAVIVAICTVGNRLEKKASSYGNNDISYSFALDSAGSVAADLLVKQAYKYFSEIFANQGWRTTIPFNPGMVGWPLLHGQREIFNILDGLNRDVELGVSGLMNPLKTISMVVGAGPDIDPHGQACEFCTNRERCHFKVLDCRNVQ